MIIVSWNNLAAIAYSHGWENFDDLWAVMKGSNYKSADKFVFFNGLGYIQSFTGIFDDPSSPIDIDVLVKYLINNGDESGLIDKCQLIHVFVDEYFPTYDKEAIYGILNGYSGLDILTEDWGELKDDVFATLQEIENK